MLKFKCQIPKQKMFCCLLFGLCHLFIICVLSFVILMSGCAMIKEGAKGFAGVSTKVIEQSRKDAITKTFNYDYNTCYNKVKRILKERGSYIYAEDLKKQLLAIYVSEQDTTPVGLFFKKIDANNTQIEVSSPSTYAKEFIATRVSSALEKLLNPEEDKPQTE